MTPGCAGSARTGSSRPSPGIPPGAQGADSEDLGQVATASGLESFGFALAPDGSIAFASQDNYILRVASPLPGGLAERNVNIPSGDGSEVWQFSPAGRHLKTYDALTGTVKFTFGYDDAGLLDDGHRPRTAT